MFSYSVCVTYFLLPASLSARTTFLHNPNRLQCLLHGVCTSWPRYSITAAGKNPCICIILELLYISLLFIHCAYFSQLLRWPEESWALLAVGVDLVTSAVNATGHAWRFSALASHLVEQGRINPRELLRKTKNEYWHCKLGSLFVYRLIGLLEGVTEYLS